MTSRSTNKEPLKLHIRWMIRRDMKEVLDIEDKSFEFPWSEDDFIRSLRQRNCIGMVTEHDDTVVGYMIYELHKNKLHLLTVAVDPEYRRRGVGSEMMAKLMGKLTDQRRNRIELEVRETNVPAQLFFRSQGFKAGSILKGFYADEDTKEDAYRMRYRHSEPGADKDLSKVAESASQEGRDTARKARAPAPKEKECDAPPKETDVPKSMNQQNVVRQAELRNTLLRHKQAALQEITNFGWEIVQVASDGSYKPLDKPLEDTPYDAGEQFYFRTVHPLDKPAERYKALMKVGESKEFHLVPRHLQANPDKPSKIVVAANAISEKHLEATIEEKRILDFGRLPQAKRAERGDNERGTGERR